MVGVPVRLLAAGGAPLASESTGADGRYAFAGLATASYEVEFVLPSGYAFTAARQGSDSRRDSDADPADGRSGLVAYVSGTAARSVDAGLLEVPIFGDGFESGDVSAWSSAVP